jgi:hypothetical protein
MLLKTAPVALRAGHCSSTSPFQQATAPNQTVKGSAQGAYRMPWALNAVLDCLLPHLHIIIRNAALITNLIFCSKHHQYTAHASNGGEAYLQACCGLHIGTRALFQRALSCRVGPDTPARTHSHTRCSTQGRRWAASEVNACFTSDIYPTDARIA